MATRGAKGSVALFKGEKMFMEAPETDTIVDTTGCGDVFHGAYAACIASARSVPQAIRIATAAAALKATRPGGRSGIPTLEEVHHFISSRVDGVAQS